MKKPTEQASLGEKFKNLTREQLLTISTLPPQRPGILGKYEMRVRQAAEKGTFCTPSWSLVSARISIGRYPPKSTRGVHTTLLQAIRLFGVDTPPTGEELVRFLSNNVNYWDKRSPYTEGRPCIPWFEDYVIAGVKHEFLKATNEAGELIVLPSQTRKPKK